VRGILKTNISQKVVVVALFIVSTFAVAGLTAVTYLSESFAVVQSLGNDPISGCFKAIGKTEVETGGIQNWTESIQNFISLIHTNKTLKLINENIVGASGPITDITGIWNVLKNDTMSVHNRKVVLTVVDNLLAAVQPGFTRMQQDALGRCIINESKSLGPSTLNMLNSFK
jgi:hypothetical protein